MKIYFKKLVDLANTLPCLSYWTNYIKQQPEDSQEQMIADRQRREIRNQRKTYKVVSSFFVLFLIYFLYFA